MLKSYEAIYDHGKMKWLGDKPKDKHAHVIVTVLDKQQPGDRSLQKRREPSLLIAGKGKIHGDIITAKVPEEDWGCLK